MLGLFISERSLLLAAIGARWVTIAGAGD